MLAIVTALAPEAAPLVERRGLARLDGPLPYELFGGEDCYLVVSGIGKLAAAAATSMLAACLPGGATALWINAGVAGHSSLEVGRVFAANRVVDQTTGNAWYPRLPRDWDGPRSGVFTVDQLASRYPEDAGCDMEAAGFCAVASRATTAELFHCLKVVSDNPAVPAHDMSAASIEALAIELDRAIERYAGLLEPQRRVYAERRVPPPGYLELVRLVRFSATQKVLLKHLLVRSAALDSPVDPEELAARGTSARAVLDQLRQRLEARF